jgi:hypothetical protein
LLARLFALDQELVCLLKYLFRALEAFRLGHRGTVCRQTNLAYGWVTPEGARSAIWPGMLPQGARQAWQCDSLIAPCATSPGACRPSS